MAKTVDPKSPQAAKLMDEIHNFTKDPAVVLLGPEIEKLFGPYGYKYSDEADQAIVADAINKAYEKSLQRHQCLKDPNASVAERWDESQRKRGADKNNLEAAQFDPDCFQSEAEFDQEWIRRRRQYLERLDRCGHSGPKDIECRNRVAGEYFPIHKAEHDAAIAQIQHHLEIYQGVVEGGLVSQLGFHFAHDVLDWSTERSAAFAGALSTTAGLVGMGVERHANLRNAPSNAPQPRTPSGEMVDKPDPTPRPDYPAAKGKPTAAKPKQAAIEDTPPAASPSPAGHNVRRTSREMGSDPDPATGGARARDRISHLDRGKGARPFYIKDPKRKTSKPPTSSGAMQIKPLEKIRGYQPPPKFSEASTGKLLETHFPASDWEHHALFLQGKRVPRAKGKNPLLSTEPDWYSESLNTAVEVKDKDFVGRLQSVDWKAIDLQLEQRIHSMPPNTKNWIIFDIRKQPVGVIDAISAKLSSKWNAVFFITDHGVSQLIRKS